jgi:endonuclease YncB( thermonuclease family)
MHQVFHPRSMRLIITLAALAASIPITAFAQNRPVRVVPAGEVFQCTPIAVFDGDGPIRCREGISIRLQGVAAREMDGSCTPGHPCPAADPISARDALVRILGGPTGRWPQGHITVNGPTMACASAGNALGNRTAAWCRLPSGQTLNCAMLATGTVAVFPRYWGNQPRCR